MFAAETFALEKEVITKRQYSLAEICSIEYETFGYMVTRHPLHFFSSFTEHSKIIKAGNMEKYNNTKVRMVGWFMTSKRIKTKKGKIMKFLSLEDLTGTFEAVLFPETYAKYADQTISMGPYFLLGTVDMENGHNLVVEKLAVLSAKEVKSVTQKDSAENNWFGDVEKISEEEFYLVDSLNAEKLRRAYL
jgi:DNA polymerase III alpha subunit